MIGQNTLEQQEEKREENLQQYLSQDKAQDDLASEDFSGGKDRKKRKRLIAGGALLTLLLVGAFAYVSYRQGQKSFANDQVTLAIENPQDIESGAEISLTFSYKNDNTVALKNGRLEMYLPDNFKLESSDQPVAQDGGISYWSIANIPAHSTDKIRIFGRLVGNAGDSRDFKATLKYRPANFNSNFEASAAQTVRIASVPVELSINPPAEGIKNEADTTLNFTLKNKSSRSFKQSKLEVKLPDDFQYLPADDKAPQEDSNHTVTFTGTELAAGAEQTIALNGSFHSQNDKETVTADLYLAEAGGDPIRYAEQSQELNISRPELHVSVSVNGTADYVASKNEELQYRVDFENQSAQELRGLTLNGTLDGNFDLATIAAPEGRVSGNQIVWSALGVPALGQMEPGAKGSVTFKVKVKDLFDITKESDKDFSLSGSFTFKNASKEIVSLTQSTKIKAFLSLDAKGYFNDDGRIANGGAFPPQVGNHTYYTIHWSLRNLFSATDNIRVVASLPQGVRWTGKYIDSKGKAQEVQVNDTPVPAGNITEEKIYFDGSKNEMVWDIPSMKANEGLLSAAKEMIFQLEVTPTDSDAGKEMDILEASGASGHDTFTNQPIAASKDKLTTRLPDDFSISDQQAIVRPR